jgi:hypothetical protein
MYYTGRTRNKWREYHDHALLLDVGRVNPIVKGRPRDVFVELLALLINVMKGE